LILQSLENWNCWRVFDSEILTEMEPAVLWKPKRTAQHWSFFKWRQSKRYFPILFFSLWFQSQHTSLLTCVVLVGTWVLHPLFSLGVVSSRFSLQIKSNQILLPLKFCQKAKFEFFWKVSNEVIFWELQSPESQGKFFIFGL
jgi:hypothetical protein